jgi:IstB-like ATP binding protein
MGCSGIAGGFKAATAQLVNELVEAADERQLSRVVARYGRLDLLLLDELGYVQVDPRGAELLSRSSPNAKNAPRSASAPTCRSANGAASSPTHGSSPPSSTASPSTPTSLETGSESYRLRTSKTSTRRKQAN